MRLHESRTCRRTRLTAILRLTHRNPSVKLDIVKTLTAKTTMKRITGAILLLAASIYALVCAVILAVERDEFLIFCIGFVGVAHFILGIYFLFAKDKPQA